MTDPGQYVVCVEFQTLEGTLGTFLPLVVQQARNSLALEPECHVFDVASDGDRTVFLYEIYTDRAAFDAHLRSDHFIAFDKKSAKLVEAKQVRTYIRVVA